MNLAMSAWNSANGLRNVNAYDDDMRLIGIRVPNLQSWDYGYDTANRIKTITDNLDGTLSQTLGYDELNRLTSVTSTADNESFTYDADGNRLTAQINGTAWTYTPDASNNRLDSFVAQGANPVYLQYDAQGNLTFYGGPLNASMYSIDGDLPPQPGIVYHFNSFNRMDSTSFNGTATNFDVNPEGQRLRKYTSTNSTWFAPDPSGTLMAEDQDGTWSDYVWLNGKLVAMIRNGNVYSVHTDQTGRPEGMSNSQGTVVWRAKNYAFDREVTAGQASGFNLGFPGQYFDSEDGLYYNGHRDYDPNGGRYIESDPIGLRGGVNTYVYASSNPISIIDPSGQEGVGPWTYAPGSQDAQNYQNGLNGCYDKQAEEFLTASVIAAGIVGGGEVVVLSGNAPKVIFLAASLFGEGSGPELDVVESLQNIEQIQEAVETTQPPPPPAAPPPPPGAPPPAGH